MLEDEELEEAKKQFGAIVETQQGTLDQLKALRNEMAHVNDKIMVAPTEAEYVALKKDLESLEKKYKGAHRRSRILSKLIFNILMRLFVVHKRRQYFRQYDHRQPVCCATVPEC